MAELGEFAVRAFGLRLRFLPAQTVFAVAAAAIQFRLTRQQGSPVGVFI
jgi:hypothetical protein